MRYDAPDLPIRRNEVDEGEPGVPGEDIYVLKQFPGAAEEEHGGRTRRRAAPLSVRIDDSFRLL